MQQNGAARVGHRLTPMNGYKKVQALLSMQDEEGKP